MAQSQFGRALRSGRRGRGFESRRFDSLAGAPEHLRDQGSGVFRYAIMLYADYKVCKNIKYETIRYQRIMGLSMDLADEI